MAPRVAVEQPAVTVVEIDDLSAAIAGVELIRMDGVHLRSQPLRGRRIIVRLDSVTVAFHSSNLHVRTRTSVREPLFAYATYGPRATGTANGLSIRPGLLLAAAPGAQATFSVEPGWESITILIPEQELRAHLTGRQREGDFRVPRGIEILQADAGAVRGLFNWGKRLVDTVARQSTLFNERKQWRSPARIEALEALLATIDGARHIKPDRGDRTRQARNLIVKGAEDYVLSRAGDDLYVTDLCKAAGVSERTLEYAFKECLGLSPMAYLTRLRLHQVRKVLTAATRGSTTVSAEALNWGFWHFGEFSRAYKTCFGELPSDTLAKRERSQP